MIKEIKMFLEVETDLNFAIDKGLREAQITIPFPQRDLHIKDGSVLHVESKSGSVPKDDHSNDQKQADEDSSADETHQQVAVAQQDCPNGTLWEPYAGVCADVRDVRDTFLPNDAPPSSVTPGRLHA